jgi:tyrosine-specific transport protein
LGFIALLTSFLAQSLALVHFLGDALKSGGEKHESVPLVLLALLPPVLFSLFYPEIFFKALNFAGGVCAVLLFGLLPVLMAWKGRYLEKQAGREQVPGGKRTLIFLLAFSFFVLFFQLSSMLGAPYIPHV